MPQSNPFQYATFLQAKQSLALRLNDTSNLQWTDEENGLYIKEALRLWNCLTQQWVQDWTTTYDSTALAWQSTANSLNGLVGSNPTSPRYQTLTDAYVYTLAQYHLLEPPTGNGTWTGTTQFSLSDFVGALQEYRDTILQSTACNVGPFSTSFGITPGTNRVQLPDSTGQSILDIRRIRYLPATGSPSTLFREDGLAMEYFNSEYMQTSGTPLGWDVLAGPPQFLTFDALADQANTLDILAMISGGIISPPESSPLIIPDDFYWVLKFGMMSDMLSKESESTDLGRAEYCAQRYQEGLKMMNEMPWILQARINENPVDTPSVTDMDNFDYEWQSNSSAQQAIVQGGIDLFAVSPTIPTDSTVSVTLSLVGNAPMPSADSSFIQVPRDVLTAILDEAQHLAAFKHGGQEFKDTFPLHQNIIQMALTTNRRLRESGIFATTLRPPVSKQNQSEPRTALEE